MKKALILFAGIGGFCQNIDWTGWDVTAVEIEPEIAQCYQDRFPNHKVIVGDAMEYLQNHWKEYIGKDNLIQASPPCQTYSKLRYQLGVLGNHSEKPNAQMDHVFIDPMLIQCIAFLATLPTDNSPIWIVENVRPYFDWLIKFAPKFHFSLGRHYIWTNACLPIFLPPVPQTAAKRIMNKKTGKENIDFFSLDRCRDAYGVDLTKYPKIKNKRQVLRNMFEPELGQYIFDAIFYNKLANGGENS